MRLSLNILLMFCLFPGSLIVISEICLVPKCCPPNQSLPSLGKGCYNSSLRFAPIFWNGSEGVEEADSQPLQLIVGDPCQHGKFRLEPEEDSRDEFHILCNGSLLIPFQSDQLYGTSTYCLESFLSSNGQDTVILPLVCFPPPLPSPTILQKVATIIYPIGLLISVLFLILTAVVFTRVVELSDTQGKSLSCHCSTLAVAYTSSATVMLVGSHLPHTICVTLAFFIQFTFMSCFFWLNVLCIDTWWRITRKPCWSSHQERVRFIWYSLYAWSIPLAFAVVTIVMELTPVVPDAYLKPNFGVHNCWFHSKGTAFPNFYAPIGLLLLVNSCLFCMSVSSVRSDLEQRAEEEISLNTDQRHYTYTKAAHRIDMFKQSLILFLVMGLNWTLELMSYFFGGPIEIWFLTDIINTSQGVIIFIVFIVRVPRVRSLASAKLLSFWDHSN